MVGFAQRGAAVHAGRGPGSHRFIRITGQRPTASFATKAALARPDAFGFLRLVRLLTLRWRQAGIVWGLRRLVELGFERRNPRRQALHLRPQAPDQGILLGVAQVAEVG
jgi:hypothetical protein